MRISILILGFKGLKQAITAVFFQFLTLSHYSIDVHFCLWNVHVSSLVCQCIVVVSHCLQLGKLLKTAQPIRNYGKHQQQKKWTKRGSHRGHLFPLFSHPFATPSPLPFLTLVIQNRGRGKLIFVTPRSTIFGVCGSWCTEKLFSESWLKCTLWNVNCQNPWLCTHTLKINWRK